MRAGMQGYILTFHVSSRSGTLITDAGEAVAFFVTPADAEPHGGDWVDFELSPAAPTALPGAPALLTDWELIGSGADHFASFRNPLVRSLYEQMRSERPAH